MFTSPAYSSPTIMHPTNIPKFYLENIIYSDRIQKEICELKYNDTITIKTISNFYYQILIDDKEWIWLNMDFTNVKYPFEPPELYVLRDKRRWDVTKIDWTCGYTLKYLLDQCIFNIMHSPSGMMAHVRQKRLWWGIFRTAPMLMLWRKRATERLYHPSRIDFAKIMEEDD